MDTIYGHGGLFKTKGVGQSILADALNVPVAVMETAGEGGPWGMAVLAAFLVRKNENETLAEFLERKVFLGNQGKIVEPDTENVKGFDEYIERYHKAIEVERLAAEKMKGCLC